MTLLTIVQDAADELGVKRPTTVIGNSDVTARRLLRLANVEGQTLLQMGNWQECVRETSFSTTASQEGYRLSDIAPSFSHLVNDTIWNRDERWPMTGPKSPQEWQAQKSWITASPWDQFRIRNSQVIIYPVPDSVETYFFEYVTDAWCTAKAWTSGESVSSGDSRSSYGHRYTADSTGTTGGTAPSHTSGSASDGTISWTYVDEGYSSWQADTDIGVLAEDIMTQGVVWRFKKATGLEYGEDYQTWIEWVNKRLGREGGAPRLNLAGRRGVSIGRGIVPLTGFGS